MIQRILFRFAIAAIFLAMASAPQLSWAQGSYFNMRTTRSENLTLFPKWTGVISRKIAQQERELPACDNDHPQACQIAGWRTMLQENEHRPPREQLTHVNDWANAHPYIIDQLNWGVEDFWETPYEFIDVSGDCEDYAITKYYSLRALGWAADKMHIMIVQDFNLGGIIHAILGVYDNGELLILDNQSKRVIPALDIFHYRPIYGINEEAWWTYTPK